jgi:hypothetical protein
MTVSFQPNLCWIGLFALCLGHLAERMFLARYAKEQEPERKSDDALAEHKSHNALAQLSVSGDKRKTKARRFDHDYEHEDDYEHERERGDGTALQQH